MAEVNIWGCIRKFDTGERTHPYCIEDACLGLETYHAVEDISLYGEIKSKRVILLNVRKGNCNPIWIHLSKEELEKLVDWGKKVLEAYDKDEDAEFGCTPNKYFLA